MSWELSWKRRLGWKKEISGRPQAGWWLRVPSSHSSWAVVVALPSARSKVGTKGTSPDPLATHPPFFVAEAMSLEAVWEQSLCVRGGHARNPCHEVQQVFPVPGLL